MLKLMNQIRWICFAVLIADLFFKTGIGTLAVLVWAWTFIHTYSIIERHFFEKKEKTEKQD